MKTFTATIFLATSLSSAVYGQRQADCPMDSKPSTIIPQRSRVAIRIVDRFTLKPVQATIMLVGKQPENPVVPHFENGIYQFKIFVRDTSVISIHASGYEMLSEYLTSAGLSGTKVFYLTPKTICEGDTARAASEMYRPILHDDIRAVLHFPQSESDMLPESGYELEILADYLIRNTSSRVELSGHTDDVGDPLKNLLLSFDRVDEVRKYLLSRHITSHRIRGKGFGSDLPVAPNDSEANRKLNRRVEIRIVP